MDNEDLLEKREVWLLLWGLPQLLFVVGFFAGDWRTVLWSVSLTVLGIACLLNATRCGRLHCYLTGPFYLLGALAVAANARGLLPLGDYGWPWIGLTIIIGGNLLTYLPERMWGQYVGRS